MKLQSFRRSLYTKKKKKNKSSGTLIKITHTHTHTHRFIYYVIKSGKIPFVTVHARRVPLALSSRFIRREQATAGSRREGRQNGPSRLAHRRIFFHWCGPQGRGEVGVIIKPKPAALYIYIYI